MVERAMTVREVAEYLNVDQKVIYRLLSAGELPGFKVAGTWRFKRTDLDAWIEDRKQQAMSVMKRDTTATPGLQTSDQRDERLLMHVQDGIN